jgi:FkbM family methyltransferase
MQLEKSSIKGIKFYHRIGTSDIKTFNEVIGVDCYRRRGMKILPNDNVMDCGGNVGAFSLLCASIGANVTVYEPCGDNCDMIMENAKLNGFESLITIKNNALVHNNKKSTILFYGNNGNFWRNSIVKNWQNKGVKVDCLNFDAECNANMFNFCKMDIEGAEMPILQNSSYVFDKMVYEWSFDIDPDLKKLWAVLDKQTLQYDLKFEVNRIAYNDKRFDTWQKCWFPACTNVFCFKLP